MAQVITYLKLTGYPAGLLLNFNVPALKAGLRRLEHPARYVNMRPPRGDVLEGNAVARPPDPTSGNRAL